jgi:hypothetical protein
MQDRIKAGAPNARLFEDPKFLKKRDYGNLPPNAPGWGTYSKCDFPGSW